MKCQKCGKLIVGTKDKWYEFLTPVWMLCWGHNVGVRISELESLLNENIDLDDVILISDISEKKSKQLKVSELIEFLKTKI